jgi:hypothetical protein
MAKFRKLKGDAGWQYPVMKGYKMGCCDCGLVHNVDFEVFKELPPTADRSEVRPLEGYKVRINVTRNNRSTAALRREGKKAESKGKDLKL